MQVKYNTMYTCWICNISGINHGDVMWMRATHVTILALMTPVAAIMIPQRRLNACATQYKRVKHNTIVDLLSKNPWPRIVRPIRTTHHSTQVLKFWHAPFAQLLHDRNCKAMRNAGFEASTCCIYTTVARLVFLSHARCGEFCLCMPKCDTVVQNKSPAVNRRTGQYIYLETNVV